MERRFEEAWRKAMEGAEVEPSGETWKAMESALIAEENKGMKRKVVFYQRLAAASVLFAFLLGALGFYSWRNNSSGREGTAALSHGTPAYAETAPAGKPGPSPKRRGDGRSAEAGSVKAEALAQTSLPAETLAQTSLPAETLAQAGLPTEALAQAGGGVKQTENDLSGNAPLERGKNINDTGNLERTAGASNGADRPNSMNSIAENSSRTPGATNPISSDSMRVERSLSQTAGSILSTPGSEVNEQSLQQRTAAKVVESPIKIQKKKKEEPILPDILATDENEKKRNGPDRFKEDVWASLSVAAGNYNSGALAPGSPVAASPSASYSATSMSFVRSNVSRSPVGSSRSAGLTIGKRITRRWVIQSGVNYLNQTSGYTSNSSSLGQAYLANYSSLKQASSVTFTNTYPINSVLEFVSIPVQAGYLIVDRKLGFQMNAGVSADFLLRNTLQDPSGQVSSFSQGAGTDSPYRSVNWAGLISTELSYRMSRQYRISIVPGIRYLFDPVFKSGSADHPYVTDIGFRFRYILR